MARIRGFSPQELRYAGAAEHLRAAISGTMSDLLARSCSVRRTTAFAEPLNPGDEDQFVGLVDQECHQALGLRAEVQAAQWPGNLARGLLVFRRVDDDGGVEQFDECLDGAWREVCDLVLGEVFKFPPVHGQEPYRVRISSRVMRCSGPGGPSAA